MKKLFGISLITLAILFTTVQMTISSCTKTITNTDTITKIKTDTFTKLQNDTITKIKIDTVLGPDTVVNLTAGLVAYYPFNGNSNDASGNQLNGIPFGGVTYGADINGTASSAATFDGSTGYIKVTDSLGKLSTPAVSVSFFINLTNVTGRNVFVSKVNFLDGTGLAYSIGMAQPGLEKIQFGAESAENGCSVANYSNLPFLDNGYPLLPNTWYHVVAVYSDSVQRLYVNGELRAAISKNNTSINMCSSNSLLLGGWWAGDIISMAGTLDEVRIYNRKLNKSEINLLAQPVTHH
jgi:hypothetical protein